MSCTLFNSSSLYTWHITLSSFFVMWVCWWSTEMVVPAWLLCVTCMYFPFKKYEWPFYLGVLCLNHQLIIYFYRIIIVIILNEPLIDGMQFCYLYRCTSLYVINVCMLLFLKKLPFNQVGKSNVLGEILLFKKILH